ncbi:ATP-binding protein [Massilia sp. 9I]|uniref:hybrid sensor histidine kinase/response regulator n=1 Tax=Massilia sp. 9I TaxID=2653152 RepID=UPI0012F39DDD|nr:ATP-binding protein [Massilia sp. 9I]VXB65902.1 Two component hybrid sensor histidine kinase/response regulator protein [Massilia sp. 9I]
MRIRTRLLILVLSILVPSFIAAALAVSYVYREEQKSQTQSVAEATRGFAMLVDNELRGRAAILRTLADSPTLYDGRLDKFYEYARRVAPGRESVIVLSDLEGRQLVNTRQPSGATLPQRRSSNIGALMQRDGADRTLVSDLFMAPIGKRYDYTIQVPVRIDGATRYYLLMGVNVATLQPLLERQDFRSEWTTTIVDRAGVVLARSRQPEQFVGMPVRAYSRNLINASREGVYESRTLDGIDVRAFFSTVPSADWKVLVSIPVSEIQRVPLQAAAMLAGLMAALLAVGVLAARSLARRAIGPIEYLGLSADALGQGKEPDYQPQGLAEIDNVAQRMAEAGRQIRHAQHELEQRVAEAVATTERAQGALLKSQKLEALGRLTGGIAHEFNNLLQTFSTALQLAEFANRDEKVHGLIQTCKKTVQRATALTGQLGSFGRIQEARRETVDACHQLRSARQLMSGALRADIDLQIECDEPAWSVAVEPLQFDLALLNLAVNARDAMPGGGVLRIEARNRSLARPPGNLPAGDYVLLTVSDSGSGMTPEVLARALDPFYTTKGQGQGTGLGLPQAYAFALQSQGLLQLESAPGKGTRVEIYLPRAPQAAAEPTIAPTQAPLPRARGKVLFVEDDPLVREAVAHALGEAGFEVLVAHDGEHAVALLDRGAQPAVVFSDIVMPGAVSGIDLAGIVRQRYPSLPVVLATGYTENQPALPGVRVLAKPYPIEKLVSLLAGTVAFPK